MRSLYLYFQETGNFRPKLVLNLGLLARKRFYSYLRLHRGRRVKSNTMSSHFRDCLLASRPERETRSGCRDPTIGGIVRLQVCVQSARAFIDRKCGISSKLQRQRLPQHRLSIHTQRALRSLSLRQHGRPVSSSCLLEGISCPSA